MFKKILFAFVLFTSAFAEEIDLSSYEKFIYSAHGEDGVLARLLELIPPKSKYCVEIGAGDGITASNTYLLRLQGWNCALFDRENEILEYKLYKEFMTAENVNDLFAKYRVQPKIDLLSINHYNEFYIWKALDEKYKPAIVVIRYNASLLPYEDKVAKYRPYFCGDGTNYFGASIVALTRLARSKGYSLIYAESVGMNLFFIRDDILEKSHLTFKNMNEVEKITAIQPMPRAPMAAIGKTQKPRIHLLIRNRELTMRLALFLLLSLCLSADVEDHLKKVTNKSSAYSMKNIDFIYLINLDQRPEKLRLSLDQLSPFQIYPCRFSAVNGWELSLEALNDVGLKYSPEMEGGFLGTCYHLDGNFEPSHETIEVYGQTYFSHCLARGPIGICLSHISVLQDAYTSGYETIWVMEDDIEVIQDPAFSQPHRKARRTSRP